MAREKHYRSLLKAISWRVTGTLDTMLISYVITREFTWAISIGLAEVITKTFLYYIHERVWTKLKVGMIPEARDYQI